MLDRYLTKRPRSGYWQLRVPVPRDVQAAYGRKEVTVSLRERDRERAAMKALPILLDLTGEWERLRRGSPPAADEPSDANLLKLAKEVFEQARELSQTKRKERFASDPDTYADYLERQEQAQIGLVRALQANDLQPWLAPAERILVNRGIAVDQNSDWFKRFVAMMAEVTVAAVQVSNRQDRGDLTAEPASAVLRQATEASEAAAATATDIRFSQLTEAFLRQWKASKPGGKITNTEQQKRATFRLFEGFWNDAPIRGVNHTHAAAFRDAVKLLHPDWARSPAARGLSWSQLITRFGNQERGLSDATMNRHMATLQELWRWASKRGHCAGDNPFDGFHTKLRRGVNVNSYVAWEPSEIRQLLTPPPQRQDMLEVIIVGLFTGMRLDEIAALTWGQVRSETINGVVINYFQVVDAKTPAGIRQVPVHPALGWLLARDRSDHSARIWPGFNEEGVGKKPGADASREFSSFKLGRGFTSRTKTFHSFRKNVTRIMERARVPENEWAQVFGHERGFTYGVYNPDGIDLVRKAEIIGLIDYPGLAIPHPEAKGSQELEIAA
ncbi:DUF6538 domain-containing protein [Sphingomonas pseudosanguinis]|uniref:DUF6538 domain-containing protein n=1 Tax=Sphingomonas pseudosanguinis TaxID=413712 RepID=UPI003F868B46